ncbi:MAG TPA: 6-carboxytetrahydropterin synthase QueD [Planctomycetota bacterium]|nr:6-carboxytetrahydropterin synthase QueD [Planctomycetota bacterium]
MPALTCRARNAIIRASHGPASAGAAPAASAGSSALDAYELHIQAEFAAAHRLREYDGNCERLHGHNWKVDVVLRGERLDRLGMLIDFREAKGLLRGVLEPLDHQCLNDLDAFRHTNPTTENIARMLYEALAVRLPEGIAVAKVTAWESDGCGATYSRPALSAAEGSA